MTPSHLEGAGASFRADPMTTAEVEASERVFGPLADALRALVELTVDASYDAETLALARTGLEAVTARLRAEQLPGAYGIRYNDERSWSWGNAVIGIRNPLATPLVTQHADGLSWAETTLTGRYEDEPGLVHTGVAAMLLDHLMGECASNFSRVTMTGTLTMDNLRPTPLGRVRMEARITHEEGRKVHVDATLVDVPASAEGPCVVATGLFIVPRWAG